MSQPSLIRAALPASAFCDRASRPTTPLTHISALGIKPDRKRGIKASDETSIESYSTSRFICMNQRPIMAPEYDSPTMDITTEKDTFHFPTPTRRPGTANSSARFGPLNISSADSAIGMSTSSLVQSPPFTSPLISQYAKTPKNNGSLERMPQPIRANTTREWRTDDMDIDRPKLSRWRSFGGIFRKKSRATTPAPLQAAMVEAHVLVDGMQVHEANRGAKTNQEQSSFGVFRRATKRGAKAQISNSKPRTEISYCRYPAASKAPHLDIDIPAAQMERYSVLFNKLPSHPDRLDSLRARRQEAASVDGLQSTKAMTVKVPATNRPRRGTEPSPSDNPPAWLLLPEEIAASSAQDLPHISSLVSRPQPLQRHNTAPTTLSVPVTKEQQLSPTFEVEENNSGDRATTSTTSSTTSPTTPTWQDLSVGKNNQRKNSWEDAPDTDVSYPILDAIAVTGIQQLNEVPYVASETPFGALRIVDNDGDWTEEKPQVAVARSLSVTKAGSRSGLKPTRVNSKKRPNPRNRVKTVQTAFPPPVPEKDAAPNNDFDTTHQIAAPRLTVVRAKSRKDELQRDLSREIWGQHGSFMTGNQLQEKQILVPNLCVVDDIDARRSVYAVMDCV